MTGNRPRDESLNITAFFMKKGAGQLVDGSVYLDANLDESLFLTPVDTTKRVSDYMIDLRSKEVRDVKILIPEKMEVSSLPAPYQIHTAWVDFSRTYSQTGNQIVMHKECIIHHRRVPRSEISAWNKIISDWGAACNEQVVLKEK